MSLANETIMHNVDTKVVSVDLDNGIIIGAQGRPIKNKSQVNGYSTINLRHPNGRVYTVYQHRLIAYAFYGIEALEADTIDHANRNRADNRIVNLIPKTFHQNAKNRDNRPPLIDEETASQMVADHEAGLSQASIAEKYYVSQPLVGDVIRKRRAYSGYSHQATSRSRTYSQDDWKDFWEDVDAGYTNAQLHRKYALPYDTISRRLSRRRAS